MFESLGGSKIKLITTIAAVFIAYVFFILVIGSFFPSIIKYLTEVVRTLICVYLMYKNNPFASGGAAPSGEDVKIQVFLAAFLILFTQTINSMIFSQMKSLQTVMTNYF